MFICTLLFNLRSHRYTFPLELVEKQLQVLIMKLIFVLFQAVLMRRGPEHEEAGFFSLRSTSQTPYTIAFENHSDANNFCNLLDLYFEDLGDFHADIVPLPVKVSMYTCIFLFYLSSTF